VTIAADEGLADGMTVDDEGGLWGALMGTGEVRRYAPSGVLLARVNVPTPAVTSCAFGGSDGAVLLTTSAARRLPDALLPRTRLTAENAAKAVEAGGLFTCRPGCTGRPATPFAG
jgi:sugar lactone lactonase YvrE